MDSPEFASAPKELDRLLKTVANVHALPELVRKLFPLKQSKEKKLFAPVRVEPASNQICPSGRTETDTAAGVLFSTNMILKLSPSYTIRNQKNCSYIVRVDKIINNNTNEFGAIPIPPFIGYILSRLGRDELDRDLMLLSDEMGITKNAIHNFVAQLLPNQDNQGNKEFKLSDTFSIVFPSNLLEVCESVEETRFFETEDFSWSQEFIPQRPSMPLSVNLMVTTLCNTSCCYCYANRSLTPLMSTVEIIDIIKELKKKVTMFASD